MPITTKTSKTYKELLKFDRGVRRRAVANINKEFPQEVLELLRDGISPTQGGEFKSNYSELYKKLIAAGVYGSKTISPVNLKLSGKLYKSLTSKQTPAKGRISFTFRDKKAKKHDKGEGHLPVRRLFPEKGEALHANLRQIIARSVRKAVKTVAKRSSDR